MKKYWLLPILLLSSINIFAQAQRGAETIDSASLHLKKVMADEHSGPEIWQDYFILSYSNKNAKRFVGVAFEHENYGTIHSFEKNSNNTYVYYAELPAVSSIKYRLVVDSVWQEDPKNSLYEIDQTGVKVSVLQLPVRPLAYRGPQVQPNGTVDFYLNLHSGAQVFITGNFSKWDPFMYPMTEINEGLYKVSIPLSGGIYYYSFIFNGQRILDPANLNVKTMQSTGERVNELNTITFNKSR